MKLAPSILAADFSNLALTLNQCREGRADQVHVDVMDGHFVPNITVGPVVIKDIRKRTNLPLDVHLMIENPEKYIPEFAKAGADYITVHIEACPNPKHIIQLIKDYNVHPGITLRPATPLESIEEIMGDIDLILVMSVEPGFSGQGFLLESLDRIRKLRGLVDSLPRNDKPEISVDGGIKLHNAGEVIDAGADILVSGSGIFGMDDPVATMKEFRTIV